MRALGRQCDAAAVGYFAKRRQQLTPNTPLEYAP
jgi:hypothetical protein